MPDSYPYKVRLQVEKPPTDILNNPVNESLWKSDSFDGTRMIQQCYDGNIYICKWFSPFLYVLPDPDSVMRHSLVPGVIDNSDIQHPNIELSGTCWYTPDQMDGYQYIQSSAPAIHLGHDTVLCEGETAHITPGNHFESYCWQDGSANASYLATQTGTYWVEVIDGFGCFARDTIHLTFSGTTITLGEDTSLCTGDSVVLSPGTGYSSYLWQDGSTQAQCIARQEGLYWVEIFQEGGCKSRDSIMINLYPTPEVDLGPDILIPPGQKITLDAGLGFQSYLWQDGSTKNQLEAIEEGTYWVVVNDGVCQASDTIQVTFEECEAYLFIPNCFTPNGDGFNDTFLVNSSNVSDFNMMIFNRWGELLFKTSDENHGWDGKANGKLCAVGTYYYLINYITSCETDFEKSGTRKGPLVLLE
jgi:gliding motility-associated-like protein